MLRWMGYLVGGDDSDDINNNKSFMWLAFKMINTVTIATNIIYLLRIFNII